MSASAKVLFNCTLCLTSPGTARLKQSEWGGLSEDVGEPCLGVMLTQNYPACLTKIFPGVGGSMTVQVSNTFLSCAVLIHSVVSNSATPWTVAHQVPLSMGIVQARILEWVAMPSSRGSSLHKDWTQVSYIAGGSLQVLSHQGSPRILEWTAQPFFRGSSWPRNRTGVSCIAGSFFSSWTTREALFWAPICYWNSRNFFF